MEVGDRVEVEGFGGGGVVRFVGDHHEKKKARVGVELDKPEGKSGGKFGGHRYFKCKKPHGVLVAPSKVTKPTPPADAKKAKKEKKSKKSKKEKKKKDKKDKKRKAESDDPADEPTKEAEAPAAARLDWTEAKFRGKDGGQKKDKFLRLMGGAKKKGDSSGAAKKVGGGGGFSLASLKTKAKKNEVFVKSGMFTGKGGGSGGSRHNVNSGYAAQKDLEDQFNRGQDLLKSKQRSGGKIGFGR